MANPVKFWNSAISYLGEKASNLGFVQSKAAALAYMLQSFDYNRPVYPLNNFNNAVKRGYRYNELIYSAITLTADTSASVSLKVYDKKTHEEIPDHPLKELLDKPNDYMTGDDLQRMRIIYQKLSGRAYFEKVRNNRGVVRQLFPLRPDWLLPIRGNGKEFLTHYQYTVPGQNPIDIPRENVLDLGLYDPLDLYQTLAPLQVASRVVDVDNSATDFIKVFWERGAMVPGIITSKLRIDDKDAKEIAQRFSEKYGGFAKWTDIAVLDQDATYQKIGQNFQEMNFDSLDFRNEVRICMVMKVPPAVLGAYVGIKHMTFSNLEGTRKLWWEDTLVPDYKYFTNQLTQFLACDFDDQIYVKADVSEVPALTESTGDAWTRATNAFNAGFITRNEARSEVHLEETSDGNVYKSQLNTLLLDEKNKRVPRDNDPDDPVQQVDTDLEVTENDDQSADKPQDETSQESTNSTAQSQYNENEPTKP